MSKHRLLGVDVLTFAATKSVIEGGGGGGSESMRFEVVESLPEQDISNKVIYLIKNSNPGEEDEYIEYAYINGKWERLGRHIDSSEIDYNGVTNKPENITKQQIDDLFN